MLIFEKLSTSDGTSISNIYSESGSPKVWGFNGSSPRAISSPSLIPSSSVSYFNCIVQKQSTQDQFQEIQAIQSFR